MTGFDDGCHLMDSQNPGRAHGHRKGVTGGPWPPLDF